jgi:hypothetical protein
LPDQKPQAHFDDTLTAIKIDGLTLRDKDVAREAQRWTSGERGPIVDDPTTLATTDLSEFVIEAVKIGAHALSATAQAQESRQRTELNSGIQRLLTDALAALTEANASSSDGPRQAQWRDRQISVRLIGRFASTTDEIAC